MWRFITYKYTYMYTCTHRVTLRYIYFLQSGEVKQALEKLLALEKQTRLAADAQSTKRVLIAIVQLCFDTGDWTSLNEHIILLTKRRGQLKMVCYVYSISYMTILYHVSGKFRVLIFGVEQFELK